LARCHARYRSLRKPGARRGCRPTRLGQRKPKRTFLVTLVTAISARHLIQRAILFLSLVTTVRLWCGSPISTAGLTPPWLPCSPFVPGAD
jgi:hypothetical protein